MTEEAIDALQAALTASEAVDGAVWPENVAAVEAFLCVTTQWRTAAIGGGMAGLMVVYVGLDYAGVRAGLDAAGIAVTPSLWSDLRVMEQAALEALNEDRG